MRPNKRGDQYARAGRYKGGKYAYALRVDQERIISQIDAEVYDKLQALSYLRGENGNMSAVIRHILRRGVEQDIADLDPSERKILEERILPNVETNRKIHRQQRREKMDQKNREMRLLKADDETRIYEEDLEDDFPLTLEDEIPAP